MRDAYPPVAQTARDYYNSEDADNFYFHIWGGEDIHIGLYKTPDEAIASASRRTVERMADALPRVDADTRVLDLGAGYGGAARYLASRFGCRVTALNLSEAENERARQMNRERGLDDRIEIVDANFEAIPAADASYDIVWSQEAILHSGQKQRVIEEVARVLKPGGHFVFSDPMQVEDCPQGVLRPVLDRIHLDSLGSIEFYRQAADRAGMDTLEVVEMTEQLVRHYSRVHEELIKRREELRGKVSDDYVARMLKGLAHWIDAGENGYLSWGIILQRKRVAHLA